VLQQYLFAPAGMTSSTAVQTARPIDNLASSYYPDLVGVRLAPLKNLSFLVGAGSAYSTARDLLGMTRAAVTSKLGEAVQKGRLVDRDLIAWSGRTVGYRSFISVDRKADMTVIFAGNLAAGAIDLMQRDLPRLLAGQSVAAPERLALRPLQLDASDLRKFLGTYAIAGAEITASIEPPVLYLGERAMAPIAPDMFFSLQDYGELKAVFDERHAVSRFDWTVQGRTLEAMKKN
jgi:hypothetical protein